MEWNWDVDVRDGGYVRGGVGGGLTFAGKGGVNGSSFFTPNLFTLKPFSQYSWFHQIIPNTPSSVLLLLCAIHNYLFNRVTFSTWISTACLILCVLLHLACFFLIHILSAGSRSWMSYRHVSRCTMWMKVWLSNIFGRVKKWWWVLRTTIPLSSWWLGWWIGNWCFLEGVLMAGGETIISTIGNSPKGKSANCQRRGICHILFGVLTVLVQGHLVIVFQ